MAKDKLKLNTYNNVHMKPIMTLCQDTRIPVMFWGHSLDRGSFGSLGSIKLETGNSMHCVPDDGAR